MIQTGSYVTVVDEEKLWTKCTNQDFMQECKVDPGNFQHGRKPEGTLHVLGSAVYARSGRTYLGLRDADGFDYLCNVEGVDESRYQLSKKGGTLSQAGAAIALKALREAHTELAQDIIYLQQLV